MSKFLAKLLKSITPQMIAGEIKAVLMKYGLSVAGFQGFILSLAIKFGAKKVDNAIEETADHIIDNSNHKKQIEVTNNEQSTVQDKINAETDLLNRN